jgi:pimeloyl-ACP methyl ester carboxylesterase
MFHMFRGAHRICFCLLVAFAATAWAEPTSRPSSLDRFVERVADKGPLLLHLPGIAGPRFCDRRMLEGLRDGGVHANFVTYDWTENDPGIHALQAYDRNRGEARKVAELIEIHAAADPDSPIYLTAHSGGCAVAIWALEQLPTNVKVRTLLMMAPALSPSYDLTSALRHVDGQAFAFTSVYDTVVLQTGTTLFGTMDGVQTAAAGFGGFVRPPAADPLVYQKLVQRKFDRDWEQYGDYGGHIGAMSHAFARAILAPLVLNDPPPTTRP